MSSNVKQNSFRESAGQAWSSVKSKGQEAWYKAKSKGQEMWSKAKLKGKEAYSKGKVIYADTKSDYQAAFKLGYKQGWKDYENVSQRFGSRTSASFGYYYGLRDRYRTEKYTKRSKS